MKVIDFMLEHIGEPVNLGFRSSFVYCDIVSEYIGADLTRLSDEWLTHEIDLMRSGIEAHDRLVDLGIGKYTDREVVRWIARHMSLDNPEPKCPREVIKKIRTSYYNKIKSINKEVATHKKAIDSFKPFGECEVKEIYTSTADFKNLIVIGKGNRYIIGKYWTRDEYLKDNKKEVFF
jgi:hypothetical protein